MLGWRLRAGILLPTNNTVLEPEFYMQGVPGVTYHATRMVSSRSGHGSVEGLRNLVTNVDRALEELSIAGAGVIAYGCMSTSFVHPDWEEELREKGRQWGKAPTVTAFEATVAGLKSLGCRRPVVLCPYGPELSAMVLPSFERAGLTAVSVESLQVTGLQAVCNVEPSTVYQAARALDLQGADSLCILATDLRTLDVVAALEADLGLPVVSSNQALLWQVLRLGRVQDPLPAAGSLLTR